MSDELGFIPAAGTLLIPILNKSHNRIPHNYKVLQYCIYEVLRRLGGGHMIQLLFIFPGGWFIEKNTGKQWRTSSSAPRTVPQPPNPGSYMNWTNVHSQSHSHEPQLEAGTWFSDRITVRQGNYPLFHSVAQMSVWCLFDEMLPNTWSELVQTWSKGTPPSSPPPPPPPPPRILPPVSRPSFSPFSLLFVSFHYISSPWPPPPSLSPSFSLHLLTSRSQFFPSIMSPPSGFTPTPRLLPSLPLSDPPRSIELHLSDWYQINQD